MRGKKGGIVFGASGRRFIFIHISTSLHARGDNWCIFFCLDVEKIANMSYLSYIVYI